jgi:SOS response regulatory protein OraA/RecX
LRSDVSGSRSSEDPSVTSVAMRLLGRRPLTEAELRERLATARHAADAIDHACERLREAGYLDDHALALDFIVNRAERLGHGPEKLVAALCGRGVPQGVAEAALQLAIERGDLSPREVLLRRMRRQLRGTAAPLTPRAYARVYNTLRRAGFGGESIRRELDRYREPASHAEPIADEATDDFP